MGTDINIARTFNYNVVEVRIDPGYQQYATILEAVTYINTHTHDANNRWLIDVGVGQFVADDITIPSYTCIRGQVIGETEIAPI
jgi:hypothetical protein